MRNGNPNTILSVGVAGAPQLAARLSALGRGLRPILSRAVRHAAYEGLMRLKQEMYGGVVGGHRVPALSGLQRQRTLEGWKHAHYAGRWRGAAWTYQRDAQGRLIRRKRPRKGPYDIPARGLPKKPIDRNGGDWPLGGKLAQMLRYKWRLGQLRASFGWYKDNKVSRTAFLWEKGQTTIVTPRMRRLFRAAGHPISASKTRIIQPNRPVIWWFFTSYSDWMRQLIIDRLWHYVNTNQKP
ncbi:MAG: hypothetical protein IJJ33_03690 [Victivallales bacterium]|nr:hypothetical protein [Victivallales bacterium]